MAATTTAPTLETIHPLNEANPVVVEAVTGDVIQVEQPCEKCGLYPHPVCAIRDLPPELQAEFPVLNRHAVPPEQPKRRRVCMDARIITTEDLVQQLKEKEERDQKVITKKVKNFVCEQSSVHLTITIA